jgi:2-pyrone-4,6-dicarboxylate lactonase
MTKAIPGPHPDPHPPRRLTLPAGACDAHCHVFGPADRFPFATDRTYTPPDAGVDRYEVLADRLGIGRAVFVQASCHGTDNAALVDALERGQGRYCGVAMIDDHTSDDELELLHRVGVRGTRINLVAHLGGAPPLDEFWRIVHRVTPLGWHLVIHLDAIDLTEWAPRLDAMPCPYIIDHLGRIPVRDGIDQAPWRAVQTLLRDERAWVKISGAERLSATGLAPYDDVIPFARAVVELAPTRTLWGTDWPHPNVRHMPDDGDLVDLLADVLGDEATRQQVLVTNPMSLYPFR